MTAQQGPTRHPQDAISTTVRHNNFDPMKRRRVETSRGSGGRSSRHGGGGRGAKLVRQSISRRGRGRRGEKQRGWKEAPARRRPADGRERRPLAELLDYLRSCSKALESLDEPERTLLATRAVEEMGPGDRALLIAADQKGSKSLERLIHRADQEAFNTLMTDLLTGLTELASNQYGSHVLESAFVAWAERLGSSTAPPMDPMVTICMKLEEERLWTRLVTDPCSAHVVRALLLALGGFVNSKEGKIGRGQEAARAGLLPATRKEVPEAIADCRRRVAASLIKLLRHGDVSALNAHASPVLQLLLRILRDCGDHSLLTEACAAVVGAERAANSVSLSNCEELVGSAAGSRVLEAVIEAAGAQLYGELFTRYFRSRISDLAMGVQSSFGPFLVQRLADGLREAPQLQLALSELDFESCLGPQSGPSQHVVVLKFLEAALRLRAGLKQATSCVFRALGLQASAQYHQAWPRLLSLGAVDTVDGLYKEGAETQKVQRLPAGGPLILAVLLRFPPETVAPITSGLSKMLNGSLAALAVEPRVARVLETALAPSSALGSGGRLKLAKAFKGTLKTLGPHPVGGWVCAALWRASLGETPLRTAFAEELLTVEDRLRKENFAVWKVCGLHQAKQRTEQWTQQQRKAGKIHALFEDILDGSSEAAKASATTKARAQEDAKMAKAQEDPFVQMLS